MNLPSLRRKRASWPELSINDWVGQMGGSFGYGGSQYPILASSSMGINPQQEPPADFYGYVGYLQQAAKTNGVVAACMLARLIHFSETRFQWSQFSNGRRGDLFGNQELSILEHPWPMGTTGDLLARAIQDVDLAGNFYCVRRKNQLYRLRPEWVTIIMGSNSDPDAPAFAWDAEVIGYYYKPPMDPDNDMGFLPGEVCHWSPIPDPMAKFRGQSWLTSVIRQMIADNAMTNHQRKYFEQGATPNIVVSLDPTIPETAFRRWVTLMKESTEGVENAYKTMWLGAGAEPHVVGAKLEDFRDVKGHGETLIAAAAGVPPIVVGLSEGLDSATYSNYQQAMRHFGDSTLRWLWRTFCSSIQNVLNAPPGAELWYDLRDVAFMREDAKDAAEIQQVEATIITQLVNSGWIPKTVIDAVLAGGDWNRLVHSGLLSVQLQQPGMPLGNTPAPAPTPIGKPKPKALPAAALYPQPAPTLLLPSKAEIALLAGGTNGNGRA